MTPICTERWKGTRSGLSFISADDTYIFNASIGDRSLDAYPTAGCGAATCSPAWSANVADPQVSKPLIAGDVIMFGSVDGSPSAFDTCGRGTPSCNSIGTPIALGSSLGPYSIIAGRIFTPASGSRLRRFEAATAGGRHVLLDSSR